MYEYDDEMRRLSDAQYEQERAERGHVVRGLITWCAVMLIFSFVVFKIMQWYLSTMPPIRFH